MSIEARESLVKNSHLIFQPGSYYDAMQEDLLAIGTPGTTYTGTQTTLIALLQYLIDKGHILELTMVQTGHHDDGVNGHAGGCAADCWPLESSTEGDWLDAGDQRFQQFLYDIGKFAEAYQTGMVGDGSDSDTNFHYAAKGYQERGAYVDGVSTFQDSGGAHVHMGAKQP